MAKRILLVEDESILREVTRSMLESGGYEVVDVEDGATALALARQNPPDAFVIDLLMPRMHGFELLRLLRASAAFQSTPVIVVSGQAYVTDKRRADELGADAFLQKPVRRHELLTLLARLLEGTAVTFWGTRGSIAVSGPETLRYGGNTPCVTVERHGTRVILDSGSGIRKLGVALQEASGGRPVHANLLISHTHWDHIQGFPFFLPAFVPGNRIEIYGPPSAGKPLEKVLKGQMDPEYFPVSLGDMAADIRVTELRGDAFDIEPFRVSYTYMNHPGVTLGYRLEADGQVVVYATDTEPYRRLLVHANGDNGSDEHAAYGRERDQTLIDFARGADLYIADSQYTPEEYKTKTSWGHTCYLDAAEVAVEAGVKRLALFSHDPMHDDDMIDRKLDEVRAWVAERGADLEVIACADGQVVRLPDEDAAAAVS